MLALKKLFSKTLNNQSELKTTLLLNRAITDSRFYSYLEVGMWGKLAFPLHFSNTQIVIMGLPLSHSEMPKHDWFFHTTGPLEIRFYKVEFPSPHSWNSSIHKRLSSHIILLLRYSFP